MDFIHGQVDLAMQKIAFAAAPAKPNQKCSIVLCQKQYCLSYQSYHFLS